MSQKNQTEYTQEELKRVVDFFTLLVKIDRRELITDFAKEKLRNIM